MMTSVERVRFAPTHGSWIPFEKSGEDRLETITRSFPMQACVSAVTFMLVLALGACGGGNDVDILECTGQCTCDQETDTCSCLGGTDCTVESSGAVTLICEGNARCDLTCGDGCRVECPGTAGCTASMGANSTGQCNGTASCDFSCAGDCSVDCPGTSQCTLACPEGADCAITSCPMVTSCGGGVLACRTGC
jgi:hypothetical protein